MTRYIYPVVISGLFMYSALHAESTLFGPSKSELAAQQLAIDNKNEMNLLKQRVEELNERVDGLTTIIEGLSTSINTLQTSQNGVSAQDFALLSAKVDRLSQEAPANQNMTTKRVESEQAKLPAGDTQNGIETRVDEAQLEPEAAPSFAGTSEADIYSEGVRLFQKQMYIESQKRFLATEKKGYKAAASNFYLGEIAYYTKKYKDAIFYYKKSAKLNDKATYIDTLLLHTGISLERTGDKPQAKIFFESIISGYPDAKSAKIAKERLLEL